MANRFSHFLQLNSPTLSTVDVPLLVFFFFFFYISCCASSFVPISVRFGITRKINYGLTGWKDTITRLNVQTVNRIQQIDEERTKKIRLQVWWTLVCVVGYLYLHPRCGL